MDTRPFKPEMQGSSPVGIIIRLLSLKVRTPVSQTGNVGFKSRRSYCDHRTVAVRQIVALLTGVRFPLVTPRMGMPSGEGSGL